MEQISEKVLEKYCDKQVRAKSGTTVKGNTLNTRGFPDRVVMLQGGRIGYLELKGTGKKPTKIQLHWLDKLAGLGFITSWADSKKSVDAFISLVELS